MKWLRKKRIFALLLIFLIGLLFYQSGWMGRWIYPIHYEQDIRISAQNYQIDPYLIAAIIRVESNYQLNRVSKKGALGIMQIMPDTADWIISQAGFTNVSHEELASRADIGIEIGAWYLQSLFRQFDGNRIAVIASYNAGPGHVRKWLNENKWSGEYKTVDQIPFGETRHYIRRVMYYYNKYNQVYGD